MAGVSKPYFPPRGMGAGENRPAKNTRTLKSRKCVCCPKALAGEAGPHQLL